MRRRGKPRPFAAVGARLAEIRRERGLSLLRAAVLMNTSVDHLHLLEQGYHGAQLRFLIRMAEAYETTVSKMLEGVC